MKTESVDIIDFLDTEESCVALLELVMEDDLSNYVEKRDMIYHVVKAAAVHGLFQHEA